MISICTTIHKDANAFRIFLGSLHYHASGPFELIVVNDEADSEIEKIANKYDVKLINYSKTKRVNHMLEMVEYYEKNKIFSEETTDGMTKQVSLYLKGGIDIWLPTPRKFNLAGDEARGDILLFMPADYVVYFDVYDVYRKCLEIKRTQNHVYGHFDWTQVDIKDIPEKPEVIVPAQHGMRVVDRALFNKVGRFDDRWFTRALGEDLFNDKCREIWGGNYRLKNYVYFVNDEMTAASMGGDKPLNYLSPDYSLETHTKYVERIKEVLRT